MAPDRRRAPRHQATTGLPHVIENAARLGDSHGDIRRALGVLTAGLDRHPTAPAVERAHPQLYAAELAARLNDPAARRWLGQARATALSPQEAATLLEDFSHTAEIVATSFPDEP